MRPSTTRSTVRQCASDHCSLTRITYDCHCSPPTKIATDGYSLSRSTQVFVHFAHSAGHTAPTTESWYWLGVGETYAFPSGGKVIATDNYWMIYWMVVGCL